MRLFPLYAALAAAFVAQPAVASWQFTKWGMTLEQVWAASAGQFAPCDDADCKGNSTADARAALKGKYSSGSYRFTAFALFDRKTAKLSQITLRLENRETTYSLIGSLRNKYGEPDRARKDYAMELMSWKRNGDRIGFIKIGDLVNVDYSPLIDRDNEGL